MAETGAGVPLSELRRGEAPAQEQFVAQAQPEANQPLSFEQKYLHNRHGEAARIEQDGQETMVASYELVIDMKSNEKRADAVTGFLLSAAQAGYKEAMGPLVFLPGEKDGVFGSIFFTLEKRQSQQPASQASAPK